MAISTAQGTGPINGLWLKVDDNNYIGGITRMKLDTGVPSITFYNIDTTGYTVTYVDPSDAISKFDDLSKLLQSTFTFIDIS